VGWIPVAQEDFPTAYYGLRYQGKEGKFKYIEYPGTWPAAYINEFYLQPVLHSMSSRSLRAWCAGRSTLCARFPPRWDKCMPMSLL
jgi:hypothetical protein